MKSAEDSGCVKLLLLSTPKNAVEACYSTSRVSASPFLFSLYSDFPLVIFSPSA
jgi:hypothetical protein